jgi:PAS domain S-box-containing protein
LEDQYQVLVEHCLDVIALVEIDGRVSYVSPSISRVLGYSPKEFVQLEPFAAVHPDEREVAKRRLAELTRQPGGSQTVLNRVRHKDGSWRWIETVSTNQLGDARRRAIVASLRDVSDRKRAEDAVREAEEKFRFIVESATGFAIFTTDLAGRVDSWNSGAHRILGYDEAEILGQDCRDFFTPEEKEKGQPGSEMRNALLKGRGSDERWLVRKGGERFWATGLTMPLRDDAGNVRGYLKILRDRTQEKRAEEQVRQSERKLVSVLANIKDAFMVVDRHWNFIQVNDATASVLRLDAADLVGKNVWETFPEYAGSVFESNCRRAMTEQVSLVFETREVGSGKWSEVSVMPSPEGLFVACRDVTAEKEAAADRERLARESERQRRIYEAALSNTPDLVYIFGLDHRFIYANEALLRMWGRTREDAIGKNCLELGYEPWHAELHDREIEQVVATRQPIRAEVPFTGTNGRRIYDYIFVPVIDRDGAVVAVAGTTRDVTERQQAELAIREQAEQLRQNDRRKDEFLAMLAHELRNPLSAISNAIHVAQKANLDERLRWSTEVIVRQVRHLTRMVDQLLDVSRITRGRIQLHREDLELTTVLGRAIEAVQPVFAERRQAVEVIHGSSPLTVNADPTRLEQIFVNLLMNAAKYTNVEGRVAVSAGYEAGQVFVTVRDNGIGIPAASLPGIFELFAQGGVGLDRSGGGLGVGLTVVDRLVRLHGGSVSAKSDGAGAGAEFTVRLPAVEAPAQLPTPSHLVEVSGAARPSVLIVDDNVDQARGIETLLSAAGHQVWTAHHGTEAIEAARAFKPRFVLLDIGLPGMNGYEVAAELRKLRPREPTTIIALTGYGQESDRARSRRAGFDHHLVKPLDFESLRSLLNRGDG